MFGQHRSESFLIYRRGRPVARLAPAEAATGRAIKDLLRRRAPDDRWAVELAELRAGLVSEESPWRD